MELDVHDHFLVVGTGLVVTGLLKSGTIEENQKLLLGPDKNSEYIEIVVRSMHFARVPIKKAFPGMIISLAVKSLKKKDVLDKKKLRKGVVILGLEKDIKPALGFEA